MTQRLVRSVVVMLVAAVLLPTSGCGPAVRAEDGAVDPRAMEVDCGDAGSCYDEGAALQQTLDDQDAILRGVACHLAACTQGHGEACLDAGLQYWGGFFITQDLAFAQELFTRSCELGTGQGCNKAGTMHEMGWGVTQSRDMAQSYYRRGCSLGDQESCSDLTL